MPSRDRFSNGRPFSRTRTINGRSLAFRKLIIAIGLTLGGRSRRDIRVMQTNYSWGGFASPGNVVGGSAQSWITRFASHSFADTFLNRVTDAPTARNGRSATILVVARAIGSFDRSMRI